MESKSDSVHYSNTTKSTIIIDMNDDQGDDQLGLSDYADFDETSADKIFSSTKPGLNVEESAFNKFSSSLTNVNQSTDFCKDKGNAFHRLNKQFFSCPYKDCRKILTNKLQLHQHYRSHQERKHKCQYCDYKFLYLKDKVIHERTHTGERPYQCHQCKKSFAQKITLSNHLLTHSNEGKNEVCDICNRAYYHKKSLAYHKKEKHPNQLGENFFICSKCDKKYVRLARYKQHTAKCQGKVVFACKSCNLGFKNKKQLENHKLECTQCCVFQCGICDAVMDSENELRVHMQDSHKTGFDECIKIQLVEEQASNESQKKTSDASEFVINTGQLDLVSHVLNMNSGDL